VAAAKLRRYASMENIFDMFKIPLGLIQAAWHIFWFMPDVILAKGGYASVIPAIVGRIFFIPVVIHESDSVPGLSNLWLARFARRILISFAGSGQYFDPGRTVLVGNPVRKELFSGDRGAAIKFFGLTEGRKTVLIIGGSQGAKKINDMILASVVMMTEKYQVIHQCGEMQYEDVKKEMGKIIEEGGAAYGLRVKGAYHLFPFLEDEALAMAYSVADVIVSRAGAGGLFEIAGLGKPAVIIPLAGSASDHQYLNASEFRRYGASVLEERNLTREALINEIGFLFEPVRYGQISAKMKEFAKPDAADRIAEELFTIIKLANGG